MILRPAPSLVSGSLWKWEANGPIPSRDKVLRTCICVATTPYTAFCKRVAVVDETIQPHPNFLAHGATIRGYASFRCNLLGDDLPRLAFGLLGYLPAYVRRLKKS
jgi:hypothetical protein